MSYTAVRAVSSLPVAGAKWNFPCKTKHKEGPQYTSFSCLFLSVFTVYTRKMPFLPRPDPLEEFTALTESAFPKVIKMLSGRLVYVGEANAGL